ncbi:MAG: hypothetical protein NTY12_02565 [Candidatus Falkowbacteria bacterium]|nr:hypothetical protein [Candidatus Falkowbacteria bacterium]
MNLTSAIIDSGKVLIQFIWDLLYFPFWWYSRGFWEVLKWAGRFLLRQISITGLIVWVQNLFTPMFGQHDFSGVVISFFVRSIQIIVRSIVMLFWLFYVVAAILLWLIAPVYILYQLILQLSF